MTKLKIDNVVLKKFENCLDLDEPNFSPLLAYCNFLIEQYNICSIIFQTFTIPFTRFQGKTNGSTTSEELSEKQKNRYMHL